MDWWVGTYPVAGAGSPAGVGEGIWLLRDSVGGLVARQEVDAPAPSFLAATADGTTLFAVGEDSPGMVVRYSVADDGALVERERVTSGGSYPCHLLVHPSGRSLYVAQYGSGSLAVLPLEPDPAGGWAFAGGIGQVFEHSGAGPHERQDGPHVHSTVLLPADGGDVLLALDLGTDELRRYRCDESGALTVDGLAARLPHGSGPRHAAVTAAGHLLVVAELSAELYLLAWDRVSATLAPLDRVRLAEPGTTLAAHVSVQAWAGGERALVGLRGPEALAVVAVDGERLVDRGRLAAPAWPRHHTTDGDRVLVAGEKAHRVAVLDATGAEVAAAPIPSPTCVIPRPLPGVRTTRQ